MDTWRGRQIHSHVYRVPEPFQNEVTKTVFLFSKILGSSLSGQDIAVELAGVAKQIYLIPNLLMYQRAYTKSFPNTFTHRLVSFLHKNSTKFSAYSSQIIEV